MTRLVSLLVLSWLITSPLLAQSVLRQADRQFARLDYPKAIELFERALTGPTNLSESDRIDARAKLGYSYQQTRDLPNAERVYHDLVSTGELPADYSKCYLYYAQTLASNGKYREAQTVYDKYSQLQPNNAQLPAFTRLYNDVSALTNNAGSYKVEFLPLNTKRAEFSPTVYKNGLVYVGSGHSSGIKRIFTWNNTPFLDLYFLPDFTVNPEAKAARLGVGGDKKLRTELIRPLGHDDYTAPTANDSRTIGYYGGSHLNDGYENRPVSESAKFSKSLNTKYHEGPAVFSADGSRVFFTRNNFNEGKARKGSAGVNKLKIFTATQTNGVWSKAEEFPFNSNDYSTGHPALSKDGQLLYFASDRPGGLGGSDLYVSTWTNDKWGEPVNVKEVNTKGNELFPFIDEKNNLYFSSDGRPGLGELDIFYAHLSPDGQQALVVRNLGEPINSAKDDFGIWTDGDRTSGFFSSNRKNGGADDDLYRFTREGSLYPCRELTVSLFDADSKAPLVNATVTMEGQGSNPQKELKTDAEGNVRICISVDSDYTFLASQPGYADNKVGFSSKNMSDDQPSRLEIPLNTGENAEAPIGGLGTTTLRGKITTQTARKPISGVKVVIVNGCDGTSQETKTGKDGTYSFAIKPGCEYTIEAMKEHMGTTGGRIDKLGMGVTDFTMFKKGDIMKIDNIYYDSNKTDLRPEAAAELDKVVDLMQKYPTMTVELRSHTDSRGSAAYNRTLSGKRAKSVVAYLKSKGIAAKRMIAQGYGESLPVNKCKDGVPCTDEEYQQDRRTEIKVLKLQ